MMPAIVGLLRQIRQRRLEFGGRRTAANFCQSSGTDAETLRT
jgi:hypothetical protein